MKYLRSCTFEELKRKRKLPTAISLFSGCGGADIGTARAGFEIRVMLEWDKNCCKTLRCNFTEEGLRIRHPGYNGSLIKKLKTKFPDWYRKPEPVIMEVDITKTKTKEILKAARLEIGECDMIYGGPPCQGFSTAGHQSLNDPRNKMVKEFIRVIREAKPKAFWMENVPGMVSIDKGKTIREITSAMVSAGYRINWDILNAADYGVPQDRKRVFIIGLRNDGMNFDALGKKNPQLIFGAFGGPIGHPEWYVKRYNIKLREYEEQLKK